MPLANVAVGVEERDWYTVGVNAVAIGVTVVAVVVARKLGPKMGKGAPRGPPGAGSVPEQLLTGRLMEHHVLPQQFRRFFEGKSINIGQFTVRIGETTHLKGIHGRGLGNAPGRWNARWSEFIEANPNATPKDIYQFAGRLMDEFGLSGLPIGTYSR